MPTEIEIIIADFCVLSKRKKASQYSDYQTKLSTAYQGETSLSLPVSERGLEEEGGRLLGWFFEQYTCIEEVYLKGNMINEYNGRSLASGAGFDALIEGLSHLKKLRVLDLSEDKYTPDQLKRLTKNVLMNHPTFTTLLLTAAFITDEHLDAITPYLSCPQLKRIYLNNNDQYLRGVGEIFERLVDKLLESCPSVQFIDLSGNSTIKANSAATNALMRWVTLNNKAFVRIPQDAVVYEQSMQNRHERFLPNQSMLLDIEYKKMQAQFEEFKTQIQDTIALQCLKQIFIERQIKQIQTDIREFKVDVGNIKENLAVTKSHISQLGTHSEKFSTTINRMSEEIEQLQNEIIKETKVREHLHAGMEQKLSEFRNLFNSLEKRMQERIVSMTANIEIDDNIIDRPIELAYIKKFKYLLVQIHIVAMTATEGTLQLGSSNTASMALMVLNIVTSMAPNPIGAPVQVVFGYLLRSMDERNTTQRMEKIAALGTEPGDVARLALTLSQRLIHCFPLAHYVKKGGLAKLLSTTEDTLHLFAENGFYAALFHAVQDIHALTLHANAGSQALTIPEIEKRAEQDVKLLLAAIVKEGAPKVGNTMMIDINRLFLYAAPTLTVIDRLFLMMLQSFCETEYCTFDKISINAEKRQKFYGRVAQSWHNYADAVSVRIENSSDDFVARLANSYSTKTHADGSIGFFHFKVPQTVFLMNQKRHISIRNQALEAQEIEETLNHVLKK